MEFDGEKGHVLEIGKSTIRPSWTYKLGHNIISIEKEEEDLEVMIQDNVSQRNILIKYFVTFRTLSNIRMVFHFLDKDMIQKILTTLIRPKLE